MHRTVCGREDALSDGRGRDELVDAVLGRQSCAGGGGCAIARGGCCRGVTLAQYRALSNSRSRGPQRLSGPRERRSGWSRQRPRGCVTDSCASSSCSAADQARIDRVVRISLTASGAALVTEVTRRRRVEIGADRAAHAARGAGLGACGRCGSFADAAGEVPEQDWSLGWDHVRPSGSQTRAAPTPRRSLSIERRLAGRFAAGAGRDGAAGRCRGGLRRGRLSRADLRRDVAGDRPRAVRAAGPRGEPAPGVARDLVRARGAGRRRPDLRAADPALRAGGARPRGARR